MEATRWQLTTRVEFNRLTATDPATLTDLERAARFQPVPMQVDRTIRRPFYGEFQVSVRRYTGRGWLIACVASGGGAYRTDAVLPEPLTLDWWTDGRCPTLTPGRYLITTTWTIRPALPWLGERRINVETPAFIVTP